MRFGSNIFTPVSMALMISSLDCWNAFSSASSHLNLVFGDNNGLNGVMSAVNCAYCDTWLTSPNQARMSEMFVGGGKFFLRPDTLAVVSHRHL